MVINSDVQDLDNFPGNIKRITLDVNQVVPTDQNGDEKMMMVASTSAYSDIDARTAIQSIYVFGAKIGWTKSSGLKGSAGKFNVTSSNNKLGVSMDSTVSGTFTSGNKQYYEITLNSNDTALISGEDIAVDMQNKIRDITCVTEDLGFQLAYKNCDVEFLSSKFYISSGTVTNSYTDTNKSAVRVAPAPTQDCSDILGFDQQVTSEEMAGSTVAESLITTDYTAGTSTVNIGLNTGIQDGDSFYITDGTNSDYSTAITVSGSQLTVPVNGTNGFDGINNSYTVAAGTYVQILRKQDPDPKPNNYWNDIDELFRYMNKSLINQIDFSG